MDIFNKERDDDSFPNILAWSTDDKLILQLIKTGPWVFDSSLYKSFIFS